MHFVIKGTLWCGKSILFIFAIWWQEHAENMILKKSRIFDIEFLSYHLFITAFPVVVAAGWWQNTVRCKREKNVNKFNCLVKFGAVAWNDPGPLRAAHSFLWTGEWRGSPAWGPSQPPPRKHSTPLSQAPQQGQDGPKDSEQSRRCQVYHHFKDVVSQVINKALLQL